MKKTALFLSLLLIGALIVAGCSAQGAPAADKTTIYLSDGGCTLPAGVSAEGGIVTVRAGGTYRVTGSLTDGQLAVNTEDQPVTLILDGVSITNPADAAITAENVKLLTVRLAEDSQNYLTSGTPVEITSAVDDASGAALAVKGSLTLTGTGSLTVGGYLNNGISASKTLTIEGGTLAISAVHHGLRGKEAVLMKDGDLTVTAAGDGIHSDDTVTIQGGSAEITSLDDGIHGDNRLTMEEGNVTILQSQEGMEANLVTLNGGVIYITAQDDGINASGNNSVLTLNDGTVYVNADGDGLDSNGDLIVNGGVLVVDGPSASNNAALDAGTESGGKLTVNGGTVLALGSAGMASAFGSDSAQCSFLYGQQQFGAGTEIIITDSQGQELMRHTAAKSGNCVIFSSNRLAVGDTCTLTMGETSVEISLTEQSTSVGGFGGMGGFGGKGGMGGMRGQRPEGEEPPQRQWFQKGERPDGEGFDHGQRPSMEPPAEGQQPPSPPEEQQVIL